MVAGLPDEDRGELFFFALNVLKHTRTTSKVTHRTAYCSKPEYGVFIASLIIVTVEKIVTLLFS